MIWRLLIGIAIIACIIGGVIWFSHGMQIYTKDREKVVTMVKDELFGTTHEEVTWVPTFKYGLLPDEPSVTALPRSYGFILGTSVVMIVFSGLMIKRSKD